MLFGMLSDAPTDLGASLISPLYFENEEWKSKKLYYRKMKYITWKYIIYIYTYAYIYIYYIHIYLYIVYCMYIYGTFTINN